MSKLDREQERLLLQARLDAGKTQAERNRSGQFATPGALARDIVRLGVSLLGKQRPIRFLDPAFGTGAFFSALLPETPAGKIESAKGFELDPYYAVPARQLWQDTQLDLQIADFTRMISPLRDEDRFNLLICNPPYVRHHHIAIEEKTRLQETTEKASGVRIAGLAGLYCYFLGLSHAWMQRDGIAGWLVPSEFMDVNYGKAIKRYLLDKVTLLRIHRFDPNDVQFDDALVSSAIVWFRNDPPPANNEVEFTFGGSLFDPKIARSVSATELRTEAKWTRFPASDVRDGVVRCRLSDLFTITRGIATGGNSFFILTRDEIRGRELPFEVFRPILPSPRLLYPKPVLARAISEDRSLLHRVWMALNNLEPSSVLGEGRVYGGGLHKLEPRELGNVDATPLLEAISELHIETGPTQPGLFDLESISLLDSS